MFLLKQKCYGLCNKDKIIYYINENNEKLGFFATYRHIIEFLYFADICGYTPVVNIGKNCAYYEDTILRTNNVFEYYFEQPSDITINEVGHSNKVITSDNIHREMVELIFTGKRGQYDYNKRYKYFMSKIVSKYLKFNYTTQKFLDYGLQMLEFGQGQVLGIHIRGTDYRKKYNNHPIYITEEECFKIIQELLDKGQYNKLFIATDDQSILDKFINKYGKLLCYYSDVFRSSDMKSVAFHENDRDKHKYKLGLEVIRDMYTLSKCNGLIAGISQVAICAQINKMAREEHYKDIVIIDKGFYKNSHNFHR